MRLKNIPLLFKVLLAAIVASLGAPRQCHAQWLDDRDFDSHTKQGIDHVYNMSFGAAEEDFRYLVAQYPHHPAGFFFLAMIDWWKILLDLDNEALDEPFIEKLDVVIEKCDSILERKPDDVTAMFFKGGALGFRGRLHANRGSWIKAANDGRLALPIVQRAYKIAPDNYDILLGIGIYNYYAEAIPELYPIVKPLMIFFPSGDKKKGVDQLVQAAEHAKYASVEASYFLLQLNYAHERRFDKALDIAEKLFARYPRNAVFHRYVGRCFVSLGNWEKARAVFSEVLSRCEGEGGALTGYGQSAKREAFYYLGVYEMNAGHLEDALENFYHCDEISRALDKSGESGFMVMANLKIGFIYDMQHKRDLAVEQYRKVLDMKKFENSGDLADQYIKTPYTR